MKRMVCKDYVPNSVIDHIYTSRTERCVAISIDSGMSNHNPTLAEVSFWMKKEKVPLLIRSEA